VKSNDADDPRYFAHTYSWYSEDPDRNSGYPGAEDNGSCPLSPCNTEQYVLLVNTLQVCGHGDWRLPTVKELAFLAQLDPDPNTTGPTGDDAFYWSGQTADSHEAAWGIYLCCGGVVAPGKKDGAASLRLVRSP
jgi:hypothetical protein